MPDADPIARVFLGSQGPALHRAADWLVGAFEGDTLGEALVVVPGGRARRRLIELLAERSAGRALLPPAVVTTGDLATRLLPASAGAVAGRLASLLAWGQTLRDADDALIGAVMPHTPDRGDWPGWWALAEQVLSAADELGAHRLRLQDVAGRATHEADAARWSALGELAGRYAALLHERGFVDVHAARLAAIEQGVCTWPGPVVLVAAADLTPMHKAMLDALGGAVTALIAAGHGDAAGFDRFGGLVQAYWSGRGLAIGDEAIAFVEGPMQQAAAVQAAVSGWAAGGVPADDMTVGLGDASLGGAVLRSLEDAGVPARAAQGRPVAGARPVQLLRALAAFAQGPGFEGLADLLRHPDAEGPVAALAGEPAHPWLTLLDRYAMKHLAARPAAGWLGDDAQAIERLHAAARSLLPDRPEATRPLGEWADEIGRGLASVYGGRRLSRYGDEDRPVVEALDKIGAVLERFALLDTAASPRCTYAQAMQLLVSLLATEVIPEPGGAPAVELVGYLELLLDDAPRLIIAGMNEQHVPAPPRQSPLLSEGTRRALGLPGDAHRLARDAYALGAMLAWRRGVRLIAARRSREGDPLMPSRLLLSCGDDALARRMARFVDEPGGGAGRPVCTLRPGGRDRFLIPEPAPLIEPISELSVTAFRDYLACPYRFYLKRVLRLEPIDPGALELSAPGFGSLAHEALRTLSGPDMAGVDDASAISARLDHALDRAFVLSYGKDAPAAARVQAQQLRLRLQAFAPVQARLAAEGWRVEHVEVPCAVPIEVDGRPFTLKGRIDRIDRHADGRYRLIDYKTADTAKPPDRTHRRKVDGVAAWVDLQLPLYLDLCAALGVGGDAELGYINLPKKPSETAYAPAGWGADELADARAQRDAVVRAVRAGVFWPPGEPPRFDDGLAGLCGDAAADRTALIRASAAAFAREQGARP